MRVYLEFISKFYGYEVSEASRTHTIRQLISKNCALSRHYLVSCAGFISLLSTGDWLDEY
jgi:hypothetical protein